MVKRENESLKNGGLAFVRWRSYARRCCGLFLSELFMNRRRRVSAYFNLFSTCFFRVVTVII
jgi:hypothetical protein